MADAGKGRVVLLIYHGMVVDEALGVRKGGAEVYAVELGKVLVGNGYEVRLLQFGERVGEFTFRGINVSTEVWRGSLWSRQPRKQIEKHVNQLKPESSTIIFASETVCVQLKRFRTILVQHGIGFDVPASGKSLGLLSALVRTRMVQALVRRSMLRAARVAGEVIAVDYVYPTWLRTFFPGGSIPVRTIPNFARISREQPSARSSFKRVLFARRMVKRRGVELMAAATRLLVSKWSDLQVTFAGEGECLKLAKRMLSDYPQVRFTSYDPADARSIHLAHDIAVVPSLGSEGTSFSLLEGMAAGCAVVCTAVGGLSNIVLDNHNGLLCEPDPRALADAIERIFLEPGLGLRLADNGLKSARDSFGFERWAHAWLRVLDDPEASTAGGAG